MNNKTENIFVRASRIYKNYLEKGRQMWYKAIRECSALMAEAIILAKGIVTFVKKSTGEITTREIASIAMAGYSNKNKNFLRFIDLAKLAECNDPAKSIISFNLNQVQA